MNVRVTEYNEKWDRMFREEAQKLREILADELVDIHHIGSTSVPGLKAKPIIDMMPVVKDIEKTNAWASSASREDAISEKAETIAPIKFMSFKRITRRIFSAMWR